MAGIVSRLIDPFARAVRQLDAALAAGGIANARASVADGARRRALAAAVGGVARDDRLGQAM